jgi:hypothetical protein
MREPRFPSHQGLDSIHDELVAQLVERRPFKSLVVGSSPTEFTKEYMDSMLTHAMGLLPPREKSYHDKLVDRMRDICKRIPAIVESTRLLNEDPLTVPDHWVKIMDVDDDLDLTVASSLEEGFYEMKVSTKLWDVTGRALYVRADEFVAAALIERKKSEERYAEFMRSR